MPAKPAKPSRSSRPARAPDATDLSNHFLLAMPGMADPNFTGTVVLVVEHSEKGALGLVVNRPTEMTVGTLLSRIELPREPVAPSEAPVFFGGPVQTDRGFVLHQPSGSWNSTVMIGSEIALTTSKDVLEAVAEGSGPQRLLVTLGYAGWGPGQLEAEIGQNAWLTLPAEASLVFDTRPEERFAQAFRRLGIDPLLISPRAGHA